MWTKPAYGWACIKHASGNQTVLGVDDVVGLQIAVQQRATLIDRMSTDQLDLYHRSIVVWTDPAGLQLMFHLPDGTERIEPIWYDGGGIRGMRPEHHFVDDAASFRSPPNKSE